MIVPPNHFADAVTFRVGVGIFLFENLYHFALIRIKEHQPLNFPIFKSTC